MKQRGNGLNTIGRRHIVRPSLGAALLAALLPVAAFAAPGAQITEYPAPSAHSMPLQVAVGNQSDIWFGEFSAGKMVRFANGQMTEIGIAPASGPMNMWTNPADDSVWFSALGDYMVHLTAQGQVTTYPIPTTKSMPMGTMGDSQGNVWFAEMFADKIGVVRPDGHIDEFNVPTPNARPTGLAVDQYGNVWFAESNVDKIGVLRADGIFNEYPLPAGSKPMGVDYSPMQKDQNLIWFTDANGNQIGSITQIGGIALYTVPTANSTPQMIMEDAAGNVWFTEMSANQIGRLRPDRTFSEYRIPTPNSKPMGLAVDMTNGSVWFAETLGNNLGQLIPVN